MKNNNGSGNAEAQTSQETESRTECELCGKALKTPETDPRNCATCEKCLNEAFVGVIPTEIRYADEEIVEAADGTLYGDMTRANWNFEIRQREEWAAKEKPSKWVLRNKEDAEKAIARIDERIAEKKAQLKEELKEVREYKKEKQKEVKQAEKRIQEHIELKEAHQRTAKMYRRLRDEKFGGQA